jgi:hypothetical protein
MSKNKNNTHSHLPVCTSKKECISGWFCCAKKSTKTWMLAWRARIRVAEAHWNERDGVCFQAKRDGCKSGKVNSINEAAIQSCSANEHWLWFAFPQTLNAKGNERPSQKCPIFFGKEKISIMCVSMFMCVCFLCKDVHSSSSNVRFSPHARKEKRGAGFGPKKGEKNEKMRRDL